MISNLLKEQTKVLHDQVEEKLMSQKIMDRSFSLQEYHNLLKYNFLFISEFEDILFSKLSSETNEKLQPEQRKKIAVITKDLGHFEEVLSPQKSSATIKNEAEALGILYVMEGSTLGGNIIARNLAKNPNFQDVSFNYFGFYGEKTGPFWKNFKEVLDEKAHHYESQDFLDGAKRAYQFLLNL